MKKLYFSLLMSFFVLLTVAQSTGTLKGKVTDANGEPVFSATVAVDVSKGWATSTDFDGNFQLELPQGSYTVKVSFIGFNESSKTVSIQNGKESILNFGLKASEQVIGEVEVVSPTKRGIVKEKEVVSVETIEADFIQNNNITIASDAIDRVPGVTLLDGQVSIRGGSGYAYGVGSRVILVIDDIPFLSPERNEILWDFIPMENIKSMDVVKGASSVLYGSSALNGIIAVNTKWPTKDKETNVVLSSTLYDNPPIKEGKWWQYGDGNFIESPHELSVMYSHLRKMKKNMDFVLTGAYISNQTHIQSQYNHRIRNGFKWRIRPEKVEGLTIEVDANTLYRNNKQFFIWENDKEGAYKGESYQDKYFRGYIDPKIKYFFNENNQITFNNRFYYEQRLGKGYKGEYSGIKSYQDLMYKRFIKNKEKEINSTISVGFINNFDRIKAISFKNYSRKGNSVFIFNTASVYTQGDFGWKDLTLAAGARFDYVSLDGNKAASKPVFNAGASYEILNKNFVRFGFGQSFRIPSVAERFVTEKIASTDDFGDIYALPNPDIKPETGFTYELGYKRVLRFPKYEATADVVAFYQSFDQMTEFLFGSYQNPLDTNEYRLGFQMKNIAKARIFGWELNYNATHKFKNVDFSYMIGYTYNYAADAGIDTTLTKFTNVFTNAFKAFKIKPEEYDAYYSRNEKNIVSSMLRYRFRHVLKMDFNIQIIKKINIGTNIRYYGFLDNVDPVFKLAIPGIDEYRNSLNYKGEFVVDVRASYQFNELFKLGFIVKNIANNAYQLRPAKMDAPRTFSLQGNFTF
ncbi:MAG: TonB-dependent receptor [Bacteroidetes bacterium]|nr:TonB-dependent receptor [Bacteroidota bacterium]